jgi:catechol 2,3-dioxygenase-like lactoylglutathione lyase family enzyme
MLDKIIAFVPTTDAERALAFYQDTLGFHLVKDDHFALVFDANGTRLRVVRLKEFKPAHFTILGWEVTDIEAGTAELEQRGVRFERYPGLEQDAHGIWTAPGGDRVAWFKDPDGNILSLSQHVARAEPAPQ